jgi:hypothetical protein
MTARASCCYGTWATAPSLTFAGRISPRLLTQREILDTNARLLRPFPIGMLCDELAVGIHGVGAAGMLPIPVLAELHDSRARLGRKLALRMSLNEMTVRLDRVGRFRRPPVLLLAAAARSQQH